MKIGELIKTLEEYARYSNLGYDTSVVVTVEDGEPAIEVEGISLIRPPAPRRDMVIVRVEQ